MDINSLEKKLKLQEWVTILKVLKIILILILIPILIFYIFAVVPEYLACININMEGGRGIDIYGGEIDCSGESKDFVKGFFEFLSVVISGFLLALFLLIFFTRKMKKKLAQI